MNKEIVYVAGGGGSPAAYIHMGIIKELLKNKVIINEWVGTSAGAIIGAYLACYLTKFKTLNEYSIDYLVSKDFSNLKDYNMLGLIQFYFSKIFTNSAPITKLGMIKGNIFYNELLALTYGMKFKDITDDFKLYITATEILTGSLVVFSKENTPDVLVADAVRASSSIQGVFVPFGIDVNDLVGGIHIDNSFQLRQIDSDRFDTNLILNRYGIKNNKKMFLIDGGNNGNCRTDIALNIKSENSQIVATSFTQKGTDSISSIDQYIDILLKTIKIMMQATENVVLEYSQTKIPDLVILRPNDLDVGTTDFGLDMDTKLLLMNEGVKSLEEYFPHLSYM